MATLTSPAQDVADFWEWHELALKNGWTDGLLVAPPTEERVTRIIDYLGRDGREVIGAVGPRDGLATIEQVSTLFVSERYAQAIPLLTSHGRRPRDR